jgi:hypothetical protein
MLTATDLCYVPTGARPTPSTVLSHLDEEIMLHGSVASPNSYEWGSRNLETA